MATASVAMLQEDMRRMQAAAGAPEVAAEAMFGCVLATQNTLDDQAHIRRTAELLTNGDELSTISELLLINNLSTRGHILCYHIIDRLTLLEAIDAAASIATTLPNTEHRFFSLAKLSALYHLHNKSQKAAATLQLSANAYESLRRAQNHIGYISARTSAPTIRVHVPLDNIGTLPAH